MLITQLPSQTVPMSEKLKKSNDGIRNLSVDSTPEEKTWGELTVDYHIQLALAQELRRQELYTLYRVKEGVLADKDYTYILNPLNVENPNYKRFPATLRCYNIIKPVIQEFLGERGQKPLIPMVIVGNKEAENIYKKKLTQAANGLLQQKFINELNAMGIDTSIPSKDIPNIEEFVKLFKDSYDQERVNDAQNIIDYLSYDLELDEKYQEAYEHWLTCGRVITFQEVLSEDIEHEIVHPLDYYFPLYANHRNLSDLPWGVRRFTFISRNEILDRLRNELDKEDLDWLENQARAGGKPFSTAVINSQQGFNLDNVNQKENIANEMLGKETDNVSLWYVQWKSFRKVGILSTIDELGQLSEVEVDETYKLNIAKGDINIDWEWITQVWQGYRLDGLNNNEYKYFLVKPLPIQRSELNSNQKSKLTFNGRADVDIDGKVISIVKTGYPYQILFNTYHFQFEKIMNKNREKILAIPMGMMPNKKGWDEDKFMYFMEAMGIAFFDETKPNALAALQGLKSIDMGLSQYATKMIDFLQSIKNEFWDAVGMNRQRYGETNSSDGKAVNEQAVLHASLITAELNRKFDKFVERDYSCLLDISKIAWINGKKANYIRSDGSRVLLDINPDDHIGTDYNIFIKNSEEEYRKLRTMESMALTLAQNEVRGSVIADMLDATNIQKVKRLLKTGEDIKDAYNKSLADQANATKVEVAKIKLQTDATKQETEMYKADKDYDAVIDREMLVTDRELTKAELESGENSEPENKDNTIDQAKMNLAYKKQSFDEKKHSDIMRRKDDEIAIKDYVAKHRPTTK